MCSIDSRRVASVGPAFSILISFFLCMRNSHVCVSLALLCVPVCVGVWVQNLALADGSEATTGRQTSSQLPTVTNTHACVSQQQPELPTTGRNMAAHTHRLAGTQTVSYFMYTHIHMHIKYKSCASGTLSSLSRGMFVRPLIAGTRRSSFVVSLRAYVYYSVCVCVCVAASRQL